VSAFTEPRGRIGPLERKPLPKSTAANRIWSMDFPSDGLADGRRLRCLTIVDDCTRERLTIEVDASRQVLSIQTDTLLIHRCGFFYFSLFN